jgi:hypothetical protein
MNLCINRRLIRLKLWIVGLKTGLTPQYVEFKQFFNSLLTNCPKAKLKNRMKSGSKQSK